MSVLIKICGVTKRDHRRNLDILEELDIHKDIVQVLQTRRLTYFGHVTRMGSDRYPVKVQVKSKFIKRHKKTIQ